MQRTVLCPAAGILAVDVRQLYGAIGKGLHGRLIAGLEDERRSRQGPKTVSSEYMTFFVRDELRLEFTVGEFDVQASNFVACRCC